MLSDPASLKVGYVVKMYPRLSETFILNEILELERRGVEIAIFSIKKPNEAKFHPQALDVKAKAYYLEGLENKKWVSWLGEAWERLSAHKDRFWLLVEKALISQDSERLDLVMQAAWVAAKVEELGLNHLHAHFATMPSTIAYFVHQITGVPFSFTAHAKDIYVYGMDEHLLREKLTAARSVITVTQYNYRYLTENAPEVDSNKIRVIYNGVNLEALRPAPNQAREPNLVLSVGRLVPKKGFHTLLEACKQLKDRGISFHCVIAGDGDESGRLLQLRVDLGLTSQVDFLGPMRQDEIIDLMHRATVLCLPCTIAPDGNRDALPTVLLEALACGLPVVSTDVSGIPEIIDSGVDGLLVEHENPTRLREELGRMLGSPELRRKFAEAGLRKARQKFDLKKNASTLLDIWLGQKAEMAVTETSDESKTI